MKTIGSDSIKILEISTRETNQILEITNEVKQAVRDSGVKEGICIVYTPHTTAAITINENADNDVKDDIIKGLDIIAQKLEAFKHYEGNSDAHIKSSMIGASETVLIVRGELCLGTWQGLFFCEFDGPRRRSVYIKII